jgi:hypothetical protein
LNPDPAVVLTIIAVSLSGATSLIVTAFLFARIVLPRIEGWCANQEHPVLNMFAMSEDAGLLWDAKRRARALFYAKLDAKQRREWHVRRRFDIVAAGGRRYTISPYGPFNIRSAGARFCVQVDGDVPVYDKLLAQKLLVEADEELFLARANVRTLSPAWEQRMAAARTRFPA